MLTGKLEKRFEEIKLISTDFGFDPFDINFEMVSDDIMHQICYLPGTYVQTTNGIKLIETIESGDRVYNYIGNETEVVNPTINRFSGEIVEIQAGSYKFSQTDDHQLFAIKTTPHEKNNHHKSWQTKLYNNYPKWIKAEELEVGDFLIVNKAKNIGNGTQDKFIFATKKILSNREINASYEIRLDFDFGQFIGLYLAEGCSHILGTIDFSFSSKENHLHELIKNGFDKYFSLKSKLVINNNSAHVISYEIGIANYFQKTFGHGCFNKALPDELIANAPKEFLFGVLNGYIHGDGTKTHPTTIGFSTTSGKLAIQIQQIASLMGVYFGISVRDMSKPIQKRRISYHGIASGCNNEIMRNFMGIDHNINRESNTGMIDMGNFFAIKINKYNKQKYSGNVHCMNVKDGDSFTLANGIITHNCSYGLPTRARHWSHGAAYEHQKIFGSMGYSKVYEVILNNDPAYAFLLETNKEIDNTMVAAHVIGHSHYFKNNYMFKDTDRNMVSNAASRANRIESYIEEYGIEKVEKVMDIAFSLDRHIDVHRGVFRKKYEDSKIIQIKNERREFDDVLGTIRPAVEYVKTGYDFPPHPEKDFLWFLANYGKLENWEKDILEIIREESYYFYPQYMTKISNEGLATVAHTEIMHRLDLTTQEIVDFACTHERVVQPGTNPYRMNPYYLGVKLLKDIEKKYGKDHMFKVCAEENDISLIRNYLTKDLVKELGLFSFGTKCEEIHKKGAKKCSKCSFIEVKNKDVNEIINNMIRPMLNYGVPELAITKINGDLMTITHTPGEFGTLDHKYAERTMELIFQLWGAPIEIISIDDEGKEIALSFDESGFMIVDN